MINMHSPTVTPHLEYFQQAWAPHLRHVSTFYLQRRQVVVWHPLFVLSMTLTLCLVNAISQRIENVWYYFLTQVVNSQSVDFLKRLNDKIWPLLLRKMGFCLAKKHYNILLNLYAFSIFGTLSMHSI